MTQLARVYTYWTERNMYPVTGFLWTPEGKSLFHCHFVCWCKIEIICCLPFPLLPPSLTSFWGEGEINFLSCADVSTAGSLSLSSFRKHFPNGLYGPLSVISFYLVLFISVLCWQILLHASTMCLWKSNHVVIHCGGTRVKTAHEGKIIQFKKFWNTALVHFASGSRKGAFKQVYSSTYCTAVWSKHLWDKNTVRRWHVHGIESSLLRELKFSTIYSLRQLSFHLWSEMKPRLQSSCVSVQWKSCLQSSFLQNKKEAPCLYDFQTLLWIRNILNGILIYL